MITRIAPVAAASLLAATLPATAQDGVEIGILTCEVTDVTNVIVYTEQDFDCTFEGRNGTTASYTGEISKIGIDLSIKENFTIKWAVLAPTEGTPDADALKGTYVGAGADVAVAKGVGAQVLVGGGENSFSLQPISVSGVDGVGASLGLESFTLE